MKDAMPVREAQVFVSHSDYLAIPEDVGPVEDFSSLAAVGPGVHVHGSSHCTGDAGCELQAGEALSGGGVGEQRIEHAGVGDDLGVIDFDVRERFGEPDGEPPDTAIQHQHVGSATEDRYRNTVFCGGSDRLYQLLNASGFEQSVGRPPDLPRRISLERLVELGRGEEPV